MCSSDLATGVVSSCAMVGFAIAKESAPAPLAGTAVGVANMGNMLGGMVMPPLVGWVLDRSWDGAMAAGARVYAFEAFRAGFALKAVAVLLEFMCDTLALGDIARAKGMSQVARDAGLSRESLYKALSGERSPGFDTILKVVGALGLKLHAQPNRI